MLEQQGTYNDLSPKLREELEKRIDNFGKSVRFKFNISKPNPDPEKYGGIKVIYPFLYTLDPKTFQIIDNDENRAGKQKVKTIGIIDKLKEDGKVERFKCVRVGERFRGVLFLNMEVIEQREMAAYLLLHPKLAGGKFADKQKNPVISIIDEVQLADEQRTLRSSKLIASNYAAKMSDKDVVEFADAMSWDSTEDIRVVRNKVEDLAEHTPDIFNDLVASDKMKYQTVVKQAFDNHIINYDPIANKISWVSTSQPIAQLGSNLDLNEVERAAAWFQLGGEQAEKVFQKIKSLLKK